jgi:hypothetical protein
LSSRMLKSKNNDNNSNVILVKICLDTV